MGCLAGSSAIILSRTNLEEMYMPLLEGKTALIFGVANKNSIAWAIAESLSREGARLALSYVAPMEKAALECSVRYLAYELGEYNIRVNAISAGALNTLAARGISGFTDFRTHSGQIVPLHRNIEQEEVGDAALFLASNLSRAITGDILYVDAGYRIVGP